MDKNGKNRREIYGEQKRWWLIIKHIKSKTKEMVEEEMKLVYAAENGYNRKL